MLTRLGQVLYSAACTVVACGVGFAHAALAGEAASVVEITAMSDGSVELEGSRFAAPETLKAKLIEIKERKPTPEFRFRVQDGASLKDYAPAIMLIQNTGVLKLGFIVSPSGLSVVPLAK